LGTPQQRAQGITKNIHKRDSQVEKPEGDQAPTNREKEDGA